ASTSVRTRSQVLCPLDPEREVTSAPLRTRRPQRFPLFPYTTLFRSPRLPFAFLPPFAVQFVSTTKNTKPTENAYKVSRLMECRLARSLSALNSLHWLISYVSSSPR